MAESFLRERPEIAIHIGGVHASREPVVLKTLLGSCIAVCLYDPGVRIGGMNHFLLPESTDNSDRDAPSRFGIHAMDLLIGAMLKLGAVRDRFVAKVFGGGHVLQIAESQNGVPQRNIDFAHRFLKVEAIPILAEDVGGYQPRHVRFETDTGRAFVKRIGDRHLVARLAEEEAAIRRKPVPYGDITLF